MKYRYIPMVLVALSQPAYAENSSQVNEEVTLTAPRITELTAQKLSVIASVDSEEIQRNNCHTLADAASLLPGMQINVYGGRGQVASLNLRGGPSNAVLVLMDGNPLRLGLGSINANTLPLSAVERIELLKGARATFYGADAVDGVINIVTKPGFKSKQKAEFSYSSHGSTDFNAVNTVTPSENDTLKLALGVSDSSGYNVHPVQGLNDGDRHGLSQRNLNASYTHAFDNGMEVYGMYNYLDFLGEYDNSYSSVWGSNAEKDENDVERHMFALNARYIGEVWNFDFGGMYTHDNDYNHDVNVEKLAPGASLVKTETISGHLANTINIWDGISFGFGGDFDHAVMKSDSRTPYGNFGDSDKVMINKAGFLSLALDKGMWLGDASYRLDDNSVYGHKSTWTAGLGIVPVELFSFGIHIGTAYRAPNFSELYYPGYGNTDLKPEKSNNGEVNIKGAYGTDFRMSYYVTAFYSKYEDMIGAEAVTYRYVNINKASNRGAEVGFSVGCDKALLKFDVVISDPKNDDNGRTLANRSKQIYSLSLAGDVDNFDYLAQFKHSSKRYISYYADDTLPSYGLVNLGGGYSFMSNKFRVGLKVDNIFDKKYESVAGYPSQGRVFSASIAIQNLF